MKLRMLSWLPFSFLFMQIVLRSACDTTFTLAPAADSELSESIGGKQPKGSELSENNGGTQSEGPNEGIKMDKETREILSEEVKMVHTKVRKGSSTCSRNLRWPRHSGAAPTYSASSSLVIGVVLQVSIGLIHVFSFFF